MVDRLPTQFGADTHSANLWKDLQEDYQTSGGDLERLEREVDVGYIADPLGLSRFQNIQGTVEAVEVQEWIYRRFDYHYLLARHQFPTFHSPDDFNPKSWVDDQVRFDMEQGALKGKNAPDPARAIFDWSMENMRFDRDCPLETAGWEAVLRNCGYCSEVSSALYYPYHAAGLHPEFFFETDWEPNMKWHDRFHETQIRPELRNQDHVFLGLPKEGGCYVYVDRNNGEFDREHPFGFSLSPRAYNGVTLYNLTGEMMQLGAEPSAIYAVTETQRRLLPHDINVAFRSYGILKSLDEEKGESFLEELKQEFSDHPVLPAYLAIVKLSPSEIVSSLTDPEGDIHRSIDRLAEVSSKSADRFLRMTAEGVVGQLEQNLEKWNKIRSLGKEAQELHAEIVQRIVLAIRLYFRALRFNPNSVHSYVALHTILNRHNKLSSKIAEEVEKMGKEFLESHPDHTPILELVGEADLILGQMANRPDLMREKMKAALSYFSRIVALEPEHPKAYENLVKIFLQLSDLDRAALWMGKIKTLPGSRTEDYYRLIMALASEQGPEEFEKAIAAVIREKREWGVDLILSMTEKSFHINITGGLLTVEAFRSLFRQTQLEEKIKVLRRAFDTIPSAQKTLAVLQARWSVFAALNGGETVWREEFALIREPNRGAVVESFKGALSQLHRWLREQYQPEETLDWLLETLSFVRKDMDPSLADVLMGIDAELANNYLHHGRKERAGVLIDQLMKKDRSKALLIWGKRVVEMKYPDSQSNLDAIDLMLSHRKQLSPQVLEMLEDARRRAVEMKRQTSPSADFSAILGKLSASLEKIALPTDSILHVDSRKMREEKPAVKVSSLACEPPFCYRF